MERLPNTPQEVIESGAFNVEYKEFTDEELRDDLISYIAEYRLQVKMHDYGLDYYSDDQCSSGQVRDVNKGESMLDKARRSVITRRAKGEPTHREEAEEYAFVFLNEQLSNAKDGDSLFWASPPGPKSEGYGDYGFIFKGRVNFVDEMNGREQKHLSMSAIRVENPTLAQYNQAMSEFTGVQWDMRHADDFLAAPVVVEGLGDFDIDHILQKNFQFQMSEDERLMASAIKELLTPVVNESIAVFREGTKAQKFKALHALENYALAIKSAYEKGDLHGDTVLKISMPKLDDLLQKFNYQPPAVGGSCGSTSSNPLASGYEALLQILGLNSMQDLLDGVFSCPSCPFVTTESVGDSCPGCGLTKEEFAKQGGEIC